MSSKYANTEYNRYQRVARVLHDIYGSAIAFHLHFDDFLARKQAMHESPDYKRLTSYYLGKISGVSDVLWSQLYGCYNGNKPPLMHVNIGPDGRVFPEFSDAWHCESIEYKSSLKCEHVWRAPYMKDGTLRYWSKDKNSLLTEVV